MVPDTLFKAPLKLLKLKLRLFPIPDPSFLKEKKESGIINSDIYKFGSKSSNKIVEKQEVV